MSEIDLYNQLKNDVSIASLVGARIYPKIAPQNTVRPYIVYHVINDNSSQCLEGYIYQSDTRFQVDCWGVRYSEAVAMKEAVKSSIVGFKSSNSISTMDDYEPNTKLFRQTIDFKLKD